jgi:hypothetical protein
MAIFDVDVGGITYEVEAPNEETAWLWANETHNKAQVLPTESNFSQPKQPTPIGREAFPEQLRQELQQNPAGAKLAAAGTALTDLYQGGKQLVGMADPQAMQEQQIIKQENPMSAVLGNAALYGGAGMAAPVMNTVKGAAVTGAGIGLMQPTDNPNVVQGKLTNAALGGAFGLGGAKGAQMLANNGQATRQALEIAKQQNAGRDALQREVIEQGYTLPPSYAGGGLAARLAEGLSGKYKTGQAAQIKNQKVTNQMARDYLGLPETASLSDEGLEALRKSLAEPYRQAAQIPSAQVGTKLSTPSVTGARREIPIEKTGEQVLEELKNARFQSKQNWNFFNRSGDPQAYQKAIDLDSQAQNLENTLEEMATASGNQDLVKNLQTARREIAKTYTIENALEGSNVSAKRIAKALERGVPLTDEMKTVAKFAEQYPDIARVPSSGDANPLTALDYFGGVGTGGMALASGANPALALVMPGARIGARQAILSGPVQRAMANKTYGIGPTRRLAEALLASRKSPMALTGATVPALAE